MSKSRGFQILVGCALVAGPVLAEHDGASLNEATILVLENLPVDAVSEIALSKVPRDHADHPSPRTDDAAARGLETAAQAAGNAADAAARGLEIAADAASEAADRAAENAMAAVEEASAAAADALENAASNAADQAGDSIDAAAEAAGNALDGAADVVDEAQGPDRIPGNV